MRRHQISPNNPPLKYNSITTLNTQIRVRGRSVWVPLSPMEAQSQNISLQRLHHVEKRIVHVLELAGSAMDELANSTGPRMEVLNSHCREFMQSIKEIQVTLREEIKSACEYRPFEKCDYKSRTANEICCKKLEYIIEQLDCMKQNIDMYDNSPQDSTVP